MQYEYTKAVWVNLSQEVVILIDEIWGNLNQEIITFSATVVNSV